MMDLGKEMVKKASQSLLIQE